MKAAAKRAITAFVCLVIAIGGLITALRASAGDCCPGPTPSVSTSTTPTHQPPTSSKPPTQPTTRPPTQPTTPPASAEPTPPDGGGNGALPTLDPCDGATPECTEGSGDPSGGAVPPGN